MRNLNCTAKLAYFSARRRANDSKKLALSTGYSVSHITNVMKGRRSVNNTIGNAMYSISRRRMKNSVKASA